MFLLSLALFLLAGWFLPWWSVVLSSLILGLIVTPRRGRPLSVALAAAVSWVAIGYILDARNLGLISQRMSGVFGLPAAGFMFLLIGGVAFVSAGLGFQSGAVLRKSMSVSVDASEMAADR